MSVINVRSEIAPLKKVLLHRPGNELLNLTPDTLSRLLFDDIPFLPDAQKEHDEFVHILRENGIEVVFLEDLMAEVLELNDEISFFYENYLNCTDIGDGAQFNDNITNINGLYMSLNHIPLYFDFNKIISEDITATLKFLNHFIRKSLKNDLKNTLIFGLTG